VARPKPTTIRGVRENEALVTIATFTTEFEASLARGALEAIGIPALVPSEARGSFKNLYSGVGAGPAELRVFESDRERAVVELHRIQVRTVE
jgi:Putative prokaryotic signal transducing protein